MIPAIADAIIALINSSPRSPTKAEIEAVLRAKLDPPMTPALQALVDRHAASIVAMRNSVRQLEADVGGVQERICWGAGPYHPGEWKVLRDLAAKHMGLRVGDILKGEEPSGLADDGSAVFEEPGRLTLRSGYAASVREVLRALSRREDD